MTKHAKPRHETFIGAEGNRLAVDVYGDHGHPIVLLHGGGQTRHAWRNTAYALTFEPAVFVYHKPSFKDVSPPATRRKFVDFLDARGDAAILELLVHQFDGTRGGFMYRDG